MHWLVSKHCQLHYYGLIEAGLHCWLKHHGHQYFWGTGSNSKVVHRQMQWEHPPQVAGQDAQGQAGQEDQAWSQWTWRKESKYVLELYTKHRLVDGYVDSYFAVQKPQESHPTERARNRKAQELVWYFADRYQSEERYDPQTSIDYPHQSGQAIVTWKLTRIYWKVFGCQICIAWKIKWNQKVEGNQRPKSSNPVVRWKIDLGEKEK